MIAQNCEIQSKIVIFCRKRRFDVALRQLVDRSREKYRDDIDL